MSEATLTKIQADCAKMEEELKVRRAMNASACFGNECAFSSPVGSPSFFCPSSLPQIYTNSKPLSAACEEIIKYVNAQPEAFSSAPRTDPNPWHAAGGGGGGCIIS
jgi:hypothetical protein